MFPNNIENLKAYSDKLNFNFDKDLFYDSKDILDKGYFKEIIEEDDDVVVITKEFVSFDRSFKKKDTIRMSKEAFDKIKADSMSNEEIAGEIARVDSEIKINSDKQNFEICAELKIKKDNLEKLLTI